MWMPFLWHSIALKLTVTGGQAGGRTDGQTNLGVGRLRLQKLSHKFLKNPKIHNMNTKKDEIYKNLLNEYEKLNKNN